MNNKNIVLASASPRRIEMLNTCGLSPQVCPSSYEEKLPFPMTPEETVMFFALGKALDVAAREPFADAVIIGSDTVVATDRIMGKPKDREDARNMLTELKNSTHRVISGVALVDLKRPLIKCFYETTYVTFGDYTDEELSAYLDTGEPYDKAGAYAIQGTYKKYISRVEGDVNNVIGFPLERFNEEIKSFR